jgi:putative transposase
MAGKREKLEDIVSKLRQVEVRQGQGMTIADAVRQIGVTQQTYYRWRKQYAGMNREQLKRLKELEKENQRLRRAVSDLTLDKMILAEAANGNFQALRVVSSALTRCARTLAYQNIGPVSYLAQLPHSC